MSVEREQTVIVCGGRDYKDGRRVHLTLDEMDAQRRIGLVVQGGYRGADAWARDWANKRRVPCVSFEADWANEGKAAGPNRNAKMLRVTRPDLVIAFPGAAGTSDMVNRARRACVPVVEMP